jgi:cellulose synthase/poly-beta-1,6-N-acetylglucosamine synthase-like glycosyltransferase
MIQLIFALYWTTIAGLFVYGVNCYVLTWSFLRHREQRLADLTRRRSEARPTPWPRVCVQLPIYNERFVAERVIEACAALDYPSDRFEIQVLDDSTDDTSARVARLVGRLSARGVPISHVRRHRRTGFKAGALADGMELSDADFFAIFDADFVPQPDYLQRCMPFFDRPDTGLVQARWGHLNRGFSWLTRAQALAIDGHFGIEQAGRCWSGLFLNFNGTAGIWRRSAIDAAGGWTADTLTEDLDLSYRAQLAGWHVEYLLDTVVPAEIPADMAAFKSQQRRWAKGSIQTARKLLPQVLRSKLPLWTKLQATLHLTHYLVHPLMVSAALLAAPMLHAWDGAWGGRAYPIWVSLMVVCTLGPSVLYVTAQRALGSGSRRRLFALPMLMLLGTGIAVSNTRAVLEALAGRSSDFVRTPKRRLEGTRDAGATEGPAYTLPFDRVLVLEFLLGLWAGYGLLLYAHHGRWLVGPFLAQYAAGFALVACCSLSESLGFRMKPRALRHHLPETSPPGAAP